MRYALVKNTVVQNVIVVTSAAFFDDNAAYAAQFDDIVEVQANDVVEPGYTWTQGGGFVPPAPVPDESDDPGNGGVIQVTRPLSTVVLASGVLPETRTLAPPVMPNQRLTIVGGAVGGAIVISSKAPLDKAGSNLLSILAIRDLVELVSVVDASSSTWRVVSVDGPSLAP